jgi:hypothetical protein
VAERLAPTMYLPLTHAACCLDCEVVFRLPHDTRGGNACPTCGSPTAWVMLHAWLGPAAGALVGERD